jgi:hypothetical protein
MTNPPPPVVVQKKGGMGCFGIGCVILLIVVVLLGALGFGLGYFAYKKGAALTSPEATTVQTSMEVTISIAAPTKNSPPLARPRSRTSPPPWN